MTPQPGAHQPTGALDYSKEDLREDEVEIVEPRELDRDEFRAFLDERVQATLHMTLLDFIEALRVGELDPEESPEVTSLAILVGARTS